MERELFLEVTLRFQVAHVACCVGWHIDDDRFERLGDPMHFRKGLVRELLQEWSARRAGRRRLGPTAASAARDITGPTGLAYSSAWNEVERSGKTYLESFAPKIPPSLFVSERDRRLASQPMPVVERCLEDWGTDPERLRWEMAELDQFDVDQVDIDDNLDPESGTAGS